MDADSFMAEISVMVNKLVKIYSVIKGAEVLFPSNRDMIGKYHQPRQRCYRKQKSFFYETNDCRFGLQRNNKFLTGKKITMTKKKAEILVKDYKIPVKGIFSEETGKSYEATLVMSDND